MKTGLNLTPKLQLNYNSTTDTATRLGTPLKNINNYKSGIQKLLSISEVEMLRLRQAQRAVYSVLNTSSGKLTCNIFILLIWIVLICRKT